MNTQKLFVIVVGMNVAMVLITGIYFSFAYDQTSLGNEVVLGINYGNEFAESELEIPNREGTDVEITAGSSLEQSVTLTDILIRGMNPLPISTDYEFSDDVEKYVFKIIQWFRGILVILLGLELFMLWKNKKTS